MDKFVCRTCLYVSDNITFFKTVEKVKKILEICVPELKPNITKDTVICSQCYYFLRNVDNFKTKCIENQKMLINHNLVSIPKSNNSILSEEKRSLPFTQVKPTNDSDVQVNSKDVELEVYTLPPNTSVSLITIPNETDIESNLSKNVSNYSRLHQSVIKGPIDKSSDKNHLSPKKAKPVDENIIEISDSDSEMEENQKTDSTVTSCPTISCVSREEDDIFEEKDISVVKNEPEEENPSFFNRRSEDGLYTCKLCSRRYKTSKGLYDHTLQHHRELKFYHCSLCHFFSLWRSALARHRALFHMEKDEDREEILFLFCYHCQFKTKVKVELVKHLKLHFSSGDNNTFKCPTCNRKFNSKWLFEQHLKAHRENLTAYCNYCRKSYTKKYLRDHILQVHRISY